jgi:IS6 family transposase
VTHSRLKARLRPMRGLKQDRSAGVVIAGYALVHTFGADIMSWPLKSRRPRRRAVAFEELIVAI